MNAATFAARHDHDREVETHRRRKRVRLDFLEADRPRVDRLLAVALQVACHGRSFGPLDLLAVLEDIDRLAQPVDYAAIDKLLRPTRSEGRSK